MIRLIAPQVWKLTANGNVYFLDFDEPILIDTSSRVEGPRLHMFLEKAIPFDRVRKVIFTHLHFDHIGNADLFPNATFHCHPEERRAFQLDPAGAVVDPSILDKFKVRLDDLPPIEGLEFIHTPGHTVGSICIWYGKERILFSGDTMFSHGVGRTDLPTSAPELMGESLSKLVGYNYKILAPGHDDEAV